MGIKENVKKFPKADGEYKRRNTLGRGEGLPKVGFQPLLGKVWLQPTGWQRNSLGCLWTELVHSQRSKAGGQTAAGLGCQLEASCWVPTKFPRKLFWGDAAELMVKPPSAATELTEKPLWEEAACWTFQGTG